MPATRFRIRPRGHAAVQGRNMQPPRVPELACARPALPTSRRFGTYWATLPQQLFRAELFEGRHKEMLQSPSMVGGAPGGMQAPGPPLGPLQKTARVGAARVW